MHKVMSFVAFIRLMEINGECTDRRDELPCWGMCADRSQAVDNHGSPFTYVMTAVSLLYRIQLLMR